MIHNVLPIIGNELNDFLKLKYSTSEDKVIVSNLVDQDGKVSAECENKIVSFLLNIEEERSIKNTKNIRCVYPFLCQFHSNKGINLFGSNFF